MKPYFQFKIFKDENELPLSMRGGIIKYEFSIFHRTKNRLRLGKRPLHSRAGQNDGQQCLPCNREIPKKDSLAH